MNEDLFKKQEQVPVRVEIVKIPTPKALRAIRELRLYAVEDEQDAHNLVTTKEKETEKSEEDLTKEMFDDDGFVVLLWNGNEPIGMGRAAKYMKGGEWYIGKAYVKKTQEKSYRGQGYGKKIHAIRLDQIRKLNGKIVKAGVVARNDVNFGLLTKQFLFKKVGDLPKGDLLECDLTDPEVVRKIEETLNER